MAFAKIERITFYEINYTDCLEKIFWREIFFLGDL